MMRPRQVAPHYIIPHHTHDTYPTLHILNNRFFLFFFNFEKSKKPNEDKRETDSIRIRDSKMDDFKVISEKFNFGGELSLRVFSNDSRENFQCAEDQAPIRQKMTMCQKVQSHASCQGHTQVSLDTFQDLFPLYCIFWLFMKSKKTRSTEFLKKICFVFSFDCNGPIKKALIVESILQ